MFLVSCSHISPINYPYESLRDLACSCTPHAVITAEHTADLRRENHLSGNGSVVSESWKRRATMANVIRGGEVRPPTSIPSLLLSLSPSLPLPFCSPCARVTEKCTCLTESTNARQTSDSAHLEYTWATLRGTADRQMRELDRQTEVRADRLTDRRRQKACVQYK